jgi:hypothetical protein
MWMLANVHLIYEDWQKIRQVLNDTGDSNRFLKIKELLPPDLSAQDSGFGENRKRYSVNPVFAADAFLRLYP